MRKFLVVFALFLAGCAPTVSEWRDTYKYVAPAQPRGESPPSPPPTTVVQEKNLYEEEQKRKLLQLLREEPAPLSVPPTVLRVFVLPYVNEKGDLITNHYLYIKVDEGRWIMGDYLLKKGEPIREFTPLEPKKEEKEVQKNGE